MRGADFKMHYVVDVIQFAVIILVVGLIAEKFMKKKGKEVKNINYYLRKGNSLPVAVLKAIGSGYAWWYKTFFKVVVVSILAYFGAPILKEEEEAQEELEAAMYYMNEEEERWKD